MGSLQLRSAKQRKVSKGSAATNNSVATKVLVIKVSPSNGGIMRRISLPVFAALIWLLSGAASAACYHWEILGNDGSVVETAPGSAGCDPFDVAPGFTSVYDGGDGGRDARLFQGNGSTDQSRVASQQCPTGATNPVVLTTGNKLEYETDFVSSGESGLWVSRNYNKYFTGIGLFGKNWISNFDYKLLFGSENTNSCYPRPGGGLCSLGGNTVIYAQRPDARNIKFLKQADGIFYEDKSKPVAKIVPQTDGTFVLYSENGDIERYTANGYVSQVLDAHGVGWSYSYNGTYPTRITHTDGKYVALSWTGGQLTTIVDPAGNSWHYGYSQPFGNSYNLLTSVTPPSSADAETYFYEDATYPGALTGKAYAGVRYSWISYDSAGRVIAEQHAGGVDSYKIAYTAGANGELVVTLTNPKGQQTAYTSLDGVLLAVDQYGAAHCGAASKDYTRDANGFPDKETDFNGNITDYDYNASGQLVRMVEGSGSAAARATSYVWDTQGNRLLTETLSGVRSVSYGYASDGRVARISETNLSSVGVSGQARTTTFSYAKYANGMLASATSDGPIPGPIDSQIKRYDALGNLISEEDGAGHKVTWSGHNGLGLPGRRVGVNGDLTDYTYDARGRITNVRTYPNGVAADTKYTYDAQGLLSSMTAPDGVVTFYEYDSARRLLDTYRAANGTAGSETSREKQLYTYDLMGNITKVENQKLAGQWETQCTKTIIVDGLPECMNEVDVWVGTPTTTQTSFTDYDELGRVIARRGNNGQNVRYAYDDNGNVASVTDSLGRVTTLTYDTFDRVATSTDAKGGITRFDYDASDRLRKVTDPRGLATTYVYDGFGQLWAQSSPDTGTSTFEYDASGLRTAMTRASGDRTTYTHDGLGRLTGVSAGGQDQTFTYDACTNGALLLCQVTDPSGSVSYAYTPQGQRASQVSQMPAGGSATVGYSYDSVGRLVGISYPGGVSAGYTYANGKLTTATVTLNGVTTKVASYINYQPFGGVSSWTYGNGLNRGYNYDMDGRLTGISSGTASSVLQSLTYGYDANDRIIKITNGANAALTQTYGYDELSRLTSMTASGINQAFAYDADGNRTSHVRNGTTDTYALSATSNRLLGLSGGVSANYTYDADGNVLTGEGPTYTYDPFNRIASSVNGAYSTTYAVNGLGQRVYKKINTYNYWFAYAPDNSLLAEYKSGQGWTQYVRLFGAPVAMVRGGSISYVHTDHLGRPELVTNGAQAATWRGNNYAFGRVVAFDGIGGLNLGFPGQYYDGETGNWSNAFRDIYDGDRGRYLQSDPSGLTGGINTYGYALAEPTDYVDPSGLRVNITISNRSYSATGRSIAGTIEVSSDRTSMSFSGFTMENSRAGPDGTKGPVPAGTYNATVRSDHKPHRLELHQVPGYSNIQIHNGNYPRNFKGCFGAGTSHSEDFLGNTLSAMQQINDIVNADATGEITVVIGEVEE